MQTPPSQSTIKVLLLCCSLCSSRSLQLLCYSRSEGEACRCYYVQVVIVGATKEIGRTAIVAVTKARGMELAGAIDSQGIGEDAGQVLTVHSMCYLPFHTEAAACVLYLKLFLNAGIALQISGMEEPLEIPVLNDLTMVLGSIAQVQTLPL